MDVSVGPKKSSYSYPYIADVEPKKREVYETVSESKEILSRNQNQLNVRKGMSTTHTEEVVDSYGGSVGTSVYGVGGSFSASHSSTTVNGTNTENITTTDSAREARETNSHTTQLSQMYQQFTAYHVGTNRAVFFMLPRPHIKQADLSPVNGPRYLEGIQEVFLVVHHEKDKDICVEANLETAHTDSTLPPPEPQPVDPQPLELILVGNHQHGTQPFRAQDNQVIDRSKGQGGWDLVEPAMEGTGDSYHVTLLNDQELIIAGTTGNGKRVFDPETRTWFMEPASLDVKIKIYLKEKSSSMLWIEGRGCCTCSPRFIPIYPHYVAYEAPLKFKKLPSEGASQIEQVAAANQMREAIGRQMLASIGSENRYPKGLVSFEESNIAIWNKLWREEGLPKDNPITKISEIPKRLQKMIGSMAPDLTRYNLLSLSLTKIKDTFNLNMEEAVALRRGLMGAKMEYDGKK
ncbi:hypothetical protein [Bacillus thuringiensis]|uniref:hypothetical protein n=1 Tax=Bacillus thuringiensis TaxID=1428 RepID=UPI001155906E|nr:hypothetical protein [Bacillus thuringiensis]